MRMRRLNVSKKGVLKVVKELDAFPKVQEDCKQMSASRGGLSIMTFCLIIILVLFEIEYYTSTEFQFDCEVDTSFSRKIKINVDITVAMKCRDVGADVLDQTGQDVFSYGKLEEEPAYFELSPKQQKHLDLMQLKNDYLRQEYHALQEEDMKSGVPDACRFYGSLEVNKVAGNFHITAGKAVDIPSLGHTHDAALLDMEDYNFSHRIDHFSFGEPVPGVVFPLDGTLYVTDSNYHFYQYFTQVVPTEVRTYINNVDTYQFAVTEQNHAFKLGESTHGPGIFFGYDVSSLMIRVREEHKPYRQFLVRLCGIIGGIFHVSGMLQSLVTFIYDAMCCRLKLGKCGRQVTYGEAVKGLPAVSLPTEVPAAPLLDSAEEQDAQDGLYSTSQF